MFFSVGMKLVSGPVPEADCVPCAGWSELSGCQPD